MPKKRMAVIDCETDPFLYGREPRPFLWGFTDGNIYRDFTTTDQLAAFLMQFDGIAYAHNGGKFDAHFLFPWITPGTEILIINGRVAKCQIGKCELRDSYCILPIPLADYNKTKIDYAKFEEEVRHLHMREIQAYLKDDCQFLFELVSQFVDTYGASITLASAAMTFWKGLGHEVPESDAVYYNIMAPWYAGGRVQCFRSGEIKQKFQIVDINSAYPFAMMQAHPYSCTYDVVRRPTMNKIRGASLYRVVARSRGALPFRDDKAALTFPTDSKAREYHCTGWELKAALDTKTATVLESIERLDFHELQHFSGYINHFYQLKKNSPKGSAAYIYAKLFMNSLYGKFAADPSSYRNYAIVPPTQVTEWVSGKRKQEAIGKLSGPWSYAGNLGGWALMTNSRILMRDDGTDEQTRSKYFNVATGASITGFVRAYLWRHICKVNKGGGKVLYCDTDSIVFSWPGKKKIPFGLSKELGDWSHEGHFNYGGIGGKKLYAFRGVDGDWKQACKGVQLEPEDIVKVAKGGEITYRRDAPSMRVGTTGSTVTFVERTVKRTAK